MNDFIRFLGHGIEDTQTCLQAFYANMKPAAVYINTTEGYDRWIERYNHNAQVYVALNPIREGARQFPKDEDVAYWCNEYIDLDAEKPRELKGYNATDAEIERLKPFVNKINNWLAEHGFKAGYNDFTGNGYRWILPVPPLKLDGVDIKKLAAKKKAFKERIVHDCGIVDGCGAHIDSVFDFKRISGMPGAENVKMETDDRPCRIREPFRGCVRDEDQNLRDYIMLMEIEPTASPQASQQNPAKQPAGKIKDLTKTDANLKKLLAGDLCEHVSRSEAELALACKLVYYGFDETDVGEILVSVPGSKAAEKRRRGHEEYITNTITKAFEWTSPRIEHKNRVEKAREAASKAFITIYQDYFDMAEQLQKYNPIHYDSGKNYWVWSWGDRSYHHGDETDILIAIQDAANVHQLTIKSKDKNEMLEAIRITGRRFLPKEVPKNWIQFKDCVVNFMTGEKFDATPEYFFVNPIPHRYGTTPATPTIDRLIKEWVPAENVEMIYEIIGYCLYNRYTINRVFVLLGAGRNGKTQYMNMIKHLIGSDGWTSTTLEMLVNNQFEGAKLFKKRAAFVGETDFKMIRKTDMLKRLSGDDSTSCQFKGKTPFDFDNYAKLIIGTNSLPETTDTTRGYYSRFIIIDFPHEFDEGKPIIDTIPEEEYENLCHKSVLILKRLLEVGKFTNEGSLEERKQRYIKKSSPLTAFLEDHCHIADDEAEPFWKFYDAYAVYVESNGYRLLSKKAVGQWLDEQGYERMQERWGDKNWLTIRGLSLMEVKQTQLSVDDVDDVDGVSVTLYPRIPIEKQSTSSTSSTNDSNIHCEGVDGVDDSLAKINKAIYRLNYSFGIKEFNVIQLLIKGKPTIENCTTEILTELLDSHLEELKIIKIDDRTYKQET